MSATLAPDDVVRTYAEGAANAREPLLVLDPLIESLVDLSLPFRAAARRAGVSVALARDTARRLDRAEYKRRQMPPGPKVTARAFGEGRRYPIAQKFQV